MDIIAGHIHDDICEIPCTCCSVVVDNVASFAVLYRSSVLIRKPRYVLVLYLTCLREHTHLVGREIEVYTFCCVCIAGIGDSQDIVIAVISKFHFKGT